MDPRIILLPRIKFGDRRLDGYKILEIIAIFSLLALFIACVITYSIHLVKWSITSPPKVITKTITHNTTSASYAMQQFVEECKKSENNNQDYGIPDVHTDNWTCSYADGPKSQ